MKFVLLAAGPTPNKERHNNLLLASTTSISCGKKDRGRMQCPTPAAEMMFFWQLKDGAPKCDPSLASKA